MSALYSRLVYRELADYAGSLAAGGASAPPSTEFPARTALADPIPMLAEAVRLMLIDLLEEAERISASLSALVAQFAETKLLRWSTQSDPVP